MTSNTSTIHLLPNASKVGLGESLCDVFEVTAPPRCTPCTTLPSGNHKGSKMKGGVFLGPARVLIQERETTAEGVRMKGVVWITEGTSLVRCAVQHLRSLSESEKRMCSIADTEANSFQDLVRRLPHSTLLDLTTQTDAPDEGLGNKKSLVGTHEAHEILAVAVLSGRINLMQHHVWNLI